jgi:N utilization substance protein B
VTAAGSGARRLARGHALQTLYALDLNPGGAPEAATAFGAEYEEARLEDDGRAFVERLIATVGARGAEIDDLIQAASKNWRVERMARVDRNILRLAAAELLAGDAPPRVVVNEAIELAKRFGTAESAAFVNGVLDRLAHQLGTPP